MKITCENLVNKLYELRNKKENELVLKITQAILELSPMHDLCICGLSKNDIKAAEKLNDFIKESFGDDCEVLTNDEINVTMDELLVKVIDSWNEIYKHLSEKFKTRNGKFTLIASSNFDLIFKNDSLQFVFELDKNDNLVVTKINEELDNDEVAEMVKEFIKELANEHSERKQCEEKEQKILH